MLHLNGEEEPNMSVPVNDEPAQSKKVRASRTVNDFGSALDLAQALTSPDQMGLYTTPLETGCALWGHNPNLKKLKQQQQQQQQQDDDDSAAFLLHQQKMEAVDQKLDWVLENYDVGTTKPFTMEEELHRLIALKSFLVLDTERKEVFEEITLQAKEYFECPIALISLVDLGRQWFLSNRGLGDVRETPRKLAFCAHAIQSTYDCFVVPDATKDPRFCDSPLVTGPPDIRFYAGAPLITPEGDKLGSLCIIDTKPRPGRFSNEERVHLKDLAAKVVRTLVRHRKIQRLWFRNLEKTGFPQDVEEDSDNEEAKDDEETRSDYSSDDDLRDLVLGTIDSCLQTIAATKKEKQQQTKHVRFATRDEVCPIESIKRYKAEIWWMPEEMHDIQMEADETVKFYRKHRPWYKRSVRIVAKGRDDAHPLVEEHMRLLADMDDARGLETRIVRLLRNQRSAAVEAVLEEQSKCREEKAGLEEIEAALHYQLKSYSRLSKQFAMRMGKCDETSASRTQDRRESDLSSCRWSSHSCISLTSPKRRLSGNSRVNTEWTSHGPRYPQGRASGNHRTSLESPCTGLKPPQRRASLSARRTSLESLDDSLSTATDVTYDSRSSISSTQSYSCKLEKKLQVVFR